MFEYYFIQFNTRSITTQNYWTLWEVEWGNNGNSQTLFLGAPKSLQMATAAMKLKDVHSLEEKL